MDLKEVSLFGVTFSILVYTPLYFYFRDKRMQQRPKNSKFHPSKKRIIKLTVFNIISNVIANAQLASLLAVILVNTKVFSTQIWVFSILFLFCVGLTLYGAGIYITSIVLKAYTIPELTKSEFFRSQLVAMNLFHHPISHILMYSGWIVAFLILCFIDISSAQTVNHHTRTLLAVGSLGGVVYSYSLIRNKTAIYQIPIALFSLFVLSLSLFIAKIPLAQTSFGTYYLGFLVVYNFILLSYLALLRIKNENIFQFPDDMNLQSS